MIKLGMKSLGVIGANEIDAWGKQQRQDMFSRVAIGMRNALPQQKAAISQLLTSKLKVRKPSFAKGAMSASVSEKEGVAPISIFKPTVWWLSSHAQGLTINGYRGFLIPIRKVLGNELGYKKFRLMISDYSHAGRLAFRPMGGKIIVFLKPAGQRNGGDRSKWVAIAVLVKSIHIPKRLDFKALSVDLAAIAVKEIKAELSRK